MHSELVTSQSAANSSLEKKIDLILDLTRRMELLCELLNTARARRFADDTTVTFTALEKTEVSNPAISA